MFHRIELMILGIKVHVIFHFVKSVSQPMLWRSDILKNFILIPTLFDNFLSRLICLNYYLFGVKQKKKNNKKQQKTKTNPETVDKLFPQEAARQPVTALADATVGDNIIALTDTVDVPIFKRIP